MARSKHQRGTKCPAPPMMFDGVDELDRGGLNRDEVDEILREEGLGAASRWQGQGQRLL